MCKLSKQLKILATLVILAMMFAFLGCGNSTVVESPTKMPNPNLDVLEPGNSRAFSINNSGAITGSVFNSQGKTVAFVLKNNRVWYSDEEVLPLTLPAIKFSINEPGDVGGSKLSGTELIPMLWRNETGYELQRLQGFQFGEVYDVNNAGIMVGECWNGTFSAATSQRAVVFSLEGTPVDLGTLGGEKAFTIGVNDQGHIVGASDNEGGQFYAFLFKDGVMQNLGTLGGTFSNANAINNRDEVVGRSANSSEIIRAFLYKDGVMNDLGTPGGSSIAFDINDKGEVVGASRISTGQFHAFLWKDGVMYDLGTLGGIESRAFSINNKGEIVGQYTKTDGSVHAFIYYDGQMFPL